MWLIIAAVRAQAHTHWPPATPTSTIGFSNWAKLLQKRRGSSEPAIFNPVACCFEEGWIEVAVCLLVVISHVRSDQTLQDPFAPPTFSTTTNQTHLSLFSSAQFWGWVLPMPRVWLFMSTNMLTIDTLARCYSLGVFLSGMRACVQRLERGG